MGQCTWIAPVHAASNLDSATNTLLVLCIGSGSEEKLETQGQGDVALTFKKLLAGDIGGSGGIAGKYSKSEWQGLVGGLNSQISQLQAAEAEKVRECLKPYMSLIVEAILKAAK
jgi:hypothetical protein